MNNVLMINNKMVEINEITDGTSGDIPLEKTSHLSPEYPLLLSIDSNPAAIKRREREKERKRERERERKKPW